MKKKSLSVIAVFALCATFALAVSLPAFFTGADYQNVTNISNSTFLEIYSGTVTNTNDSTSSPGSSLNQTFNLSSYFSLSENLVEAPTITAANSSWLEFNESNYVEIPYSESLNISNQTGQISVVSRMLFRQNETTESESILGNRDSTNPHQGGVYFVKYNTQIFFYTRNATGTQTYSSKTNFPRDEFFQIAGIWDGTTQSFYFNGSLADSDAANGIGLSQENFKIGLGAEASIGLNGSIDYVLVYNQTLTDEELDIIDYNQGVNPITINTTHLDRWQTMFVLSDDSVIYVGADGVLYQSTDNATTFTSVYSFDSNFGITERSMGFFQDSANNTFMGFPSENVLYKSPSNDDGTYNLSNWEVSLTMDGAYSYYWDDGLKEQADGTLIFAEYSDGTQDENRGLVYRLNDKSTNDWELVYNDSAVYGEDYCAEHAHGVWVNPYVDGTIYVGFGDDYRRKVVKSEDYGDTWSLIHRNYEIGISWQPTAMAFTEDYVLLFEDFSPEGSVSKIWRTSDDVNWDCVFNCDGRYTGAYFWAREDNNGVIYTALENGNNQTDKVIIASDDGFNTTYIVKNYSKSVVGTSTAGWGHASEFDSNNQFYVRGLTGLLNEKTMRIISKGKPSAILEMHFDEGNGTSAYDYSGSENHGTLMEDPIWNSTGYREIEGFITSTTAGLVSPASKLYENNLVNISYSYYTMNSIYNYLVAYYPFDADDVNTTSFTMWDWTDNNNNGTATGTAVVDNESIYGNEYTNNNSNSYISVPYTNDFNMTGKNLTVSLWANLGVQTSQSRLVALAQDSTAYANAVWGFECTATQCFADTFNSVGTGVAGQYYTYTPNTWQHWVAVYTPGVIKLYIDGELESTRTNADFDDFYGAANGDLQIGAGKLTNTDRRLNGSVDEIMIFNTSLTAENIEAIYNNQSQRFKSSGSIGYSNQTLLNIPAGSNRINVTSNFTNLGGNINISLSSYNVSWTSTTSQELSSVNEFTIPTDTTNLTINYTLTPDTYGFFTNMLIPSISYENWTYTAPASATPTSTSSGSSTSYPIYSVNPEQFEEGVTRSLGENWKLRFNFYSTAGNLESHTLTLDDVRFNVNEVVLTIESDRQTFLLQVGDEQVVDIDGDGYSDISVKIESLNPGIRRAKVTLQPKPGIYMIEETPATNITSETSENQTSMQPTSADKTIFAIGALVTAVILGFAVFLIRKVRKKKRR